MRDFAKSIHVGNSDTRSEYNAEIHRLEKKMEQLRSMGQGKQANDVEKQIEKLQKELRELGNSKVGNAKWTILEVYNPNMPNDGKYAGTIEANTKYEAEEKFKKENPNIENRVIAVKVKNSDGTEKLFHSLEKDVEKKEEKNDEEIEKVGNYSPFIEAAKRHMGENKTKADAEYWQYVIDKINKNDPEERAFIDTAKRELARTKDNLARIGNSASYDMTEKDYENEYKSLVAKRNNTQKGSKEYEDIQKRLEEIRKKIGRSPFGNSASDDKFAYVMREFDEGKLKTPDGKVVTDPAQAKAIAYSESKKTENGCARARNAIKKIKE